MTKCGKQQQQPTPRLPTAFPIRQQWIAARCYACWRSCCIRGDWTQRPTGWRNGVSAGPRRPTVLLTDSPGISASACLPDMAVWASACQVCRLRIATTPPPVCGFLLSLLVSFLPTVFGCCVMYPRFNLSLCYLLGVWHVRLLCKCKLAKLVGHPKLLPFVMAEVRVAAALPILVSFWPVLFVCCVVVSIVIISYLCYMFVRLLGSLLSDFVWLLAGVKNSGERMQYCVCALWKNLMSIKLDLFTSCAFWHRLLIFFVTISVDCSYVSLFGPVAK